MTQVILILVFSMHLLLVNVAMAGPLVALVLRRRQVRHADALAGSLGLELIHAALACLVAGLLLGAGLLALVWHNAPGTYVTALRAVPASRYWFGLGELVFYVLCMGLIAWRWNRTRRSVAISIFAVLAATDLMFHFPPLFTIIAVVAERPEMLRRTIDRSTYYRLMLDGEVLARVLHVWLASLAVTGVAVCVMAARRSAREASPRSDAHVCRLGAGLALVTTVLQLPVGLWVLFMLPENARTSLLGRDVLATGMFALAVLLTLHLLYVLAVIALGETDTKKVREAALATVAIAVLMTGSLHRVEGRTSLGESGRSQPSVTQTFAYTKVESHEA